MSARLKSIAKHLLFEFAPLLRFQGQSGRGAGQQAAHTDGLTGFITKAVIARIDALNRLFDLLEQLALAIARALLQGMLFFKRGAVGGVGHHRRVFAQVLGGLSRTGQDVLLEQGQLQAEIRHLLVVHVLIVGHGQNFRI